MENLPGWNFSLSLLGNLFFLGHYTVSNCKWLPMIRMFVVPSFSG